MLSIIVVEGPILRDYYNFYDNFILKLVVVEGPIFEGLLQQHSI